MKQALLPTLRCPACAGDLTLNEPEMAHQEIWSGQLICSQGHAYKIEKGMPYLYVDDDRWLSKAREADGWVQYHKEEGIYDLIDDPVDFYIPYFPQEPWQTISYSVDYALAQLNLTGNERVLDLGAGRGWAAKQFALRGCDVVALDIVPDENIGLGRGKAIMENAGVYFDRMIADGENLPFHDGQFDIVFCAATLHHTSYLDLLIQQIQRVLKVGGRLCAINEPSISMLEDEALMLNAETMDELKYGINERRPNIMAYYQCLSENHLPISKLECSAHVDRDDSRILLMTYDVGAVWPPFMLNHPIKTYGRTFNYIRNRLKKWYRGITDNLVVPSDLDVRSQKNFEILLWTSQGIILFATKQAAS